MTAWPDPYDVLGVSPDASIDEIRIAYRHRIRALHPDRGGPDDVVAHGEIAAVNEAWRRLSSDPFGSFAVGSVEAPGEGHEVGVDAQGQATESATYGDDGPAPRVPRMVVAIALVLLLAWLAIFIVIALSQSG